MAPRVPAFLPEVGPQGGALPRMSVDTPAGAFGDGSAEGWQGIGRQLISAGDELYKRAQALQDLKNQTEAKEADTKYIMEVGQMHAEFNSLQGKAAVEAYPDYQKRLASLRQDISKGMSNDMSRKMFDQQSLTTMGRTIFSGASHAATQNKRWALGTSAARVAAVGDQALANPTDDGQFKQSIGTLWAETQQQAEMLGWGKEQMDQAFVEGKSNLWAKRIEGLAKTQPFTAKKMLDEATKTGEIRGETMGKVTAVVQQQLYTVGARNISHEISNGKDLWVGSKIVPIEMAAEAISKREGFRGDYSILGPEIFDKKTGASRGRPLGKYQVLPENLPRWLAESGLPPMTPQEFLRNPQAQDALFKKIFGSMMERHGNFNDAASEWHSGVSLKEAIAKGRNDGYTSTEAYVRDTNATLAQNAPLSERVTRGREIAAQISPDNPLLSDYVETRIQADFGQDQRIRSNEQWANRQLIETGLMGGADGRIPTTVEELRAIDPKIDAAWARLDPDKQRGYLKVLAANAKGDRGWTEENLKEYQRLKGMAQADPAAFVDADMISTNLPISAKKEFIGLQTKLKTKAEADPRVTRALNTLAPMLQAAGVTKAQNKDTFYEYVGALQDALDDWQAETKTPPKAKDVELIGARLLQKQSVGLWGREPDPSGWGKEPLFSVQVPDDEAARIKALPRWQGVEPTDDLIKRYYVREQYQKLYGGKAKQDAARPQVPMSR